MKQNCVRVTFYNPTEKKDRILLGIIKGEDEHFVDLLTSRKLYRISKRFILKIETTNERFRGR